jgi:hypothetical protein
MKRLVLAAVGLGGAAAAGWAALVQKQGDSEIVYEGSELSAVTGDDHVIHGEITLRNVGKAGAVAHKVHGRIVSGPPGRVLVTRQGSRPPERGWWQSNCLTPGQACVAEVEIELDEPATAPLVIELDTHDIGRRLVEHRLARLTVRAPVKESTPAP